MTQKAYHNDGIPQGVFVTDSDALSGTVSIPYLGFHSLPDWQRPAFTKPCRNGREAGSTKVPKRLHETLPETFRKGLRDMVLETHRHPFAKLPRETLQY